MAQNNDLAKRTACFCNYWICGWGGVLGYIVGELQSRIEPTEYEFSVNTWGYHCLNQVFDNAIDSGIKVTVPENVKSIGICGPAKIIPDGLDWLNRAYKTIFDQAGLVKHELLYILQKRHPNCFLVHTDADKGLIVKANTDGQNNGVFVLGENNKDLAQGYLCRCKKVIAEGIEEQEDQICGYRFREHF